MYCPKCKVGGKDGDFCGKCGERTVFSKFPCPFCQAPNQVDSKYCEHCGGLIQHSAEKFLEEMSKEKEKKDNKNKGGK